MVEKRSKAQLDETERKLVTFEVLYRNETTKMDQQFSTCEQKMQNQFDELKEEATRSVTEADE